MKDYIRYTIVLALITVLCIGSVSAVGSGTASENKIANETIQIQSTIVSAPSEIDQVKLADIKATLPLEIQQSLDEQITFNENVTKAIVEKEAQLVKFPLIINDSYDITGEAQSFFVGNSTTSLEPAYSRSGPIQANLSSSAVILPVNQIPTGGFIEFGSDGKTRIFTSEGTQISYAVDDKSEIVTVPPGKVLPATHVIGIPNGAAIHTKGSREYITMKGKVILIIIDQSSKETLGDRIVPSSLSYQWVEYAESDPYYIAAVHSDWGIPHSPNLTVPAYNANILFNGIEPSNGSMIFQPVTAFNYYGHSLINGSDSRTDPAILNIWTGASWICPPDNNYCTHSYPVLSFSQGELAYGAVFWYEAPVSEWLIYLVNGNNQGTWDFSDQYDYSLPTRAVITYEYGGSLHLGDSPLDQDKITSTTFSNISVWDAYGNQISSLHWSGIVNLKDHKKTTGLNVDLSQAPSTVILNTSDHRTKIGIFQNSTGNWYLDFNGNGIWDAGDRQYTFGSYGVLPVIGDWIGDRRSELGVFLNGVWNLDFNGNYLWDGPVTDRQFAFGAIGDQPVVGDWSRDGITKIGVFRTPGVWILDYNGNGNWDGAPPDTIYGFGAIGDVPVVGDWNRDGHKEIGLFRSPGVWILDYNGNNAWDGTPPDQIVGFGAVGDIPVIGDWNGDSLDEIGLYRDGVWLLDYNANNAWDGPIIDRILTYNPTGGSIPVAGNWN